MATQDVVLKDGTNVTVRTNSKLRDIVVQHTAQAQRGFEDAVLDQIVLLKERIVSWDYGDVTTELIEDLDDDDGVKLLQAINGTAPDPNGSKTSSTSVSTESENQDGDGTSSASVKSTDARQAKPSKKTLSSAPS